MNNFVDDLSCKECELIVNEGMDVKTTGVNNEMMTQGVCNSFKNTEDDEESSACPLRCSTTQEPFVCVFGEKHWFPPNHIFCDVRNHVMKFGSVQDVVWCRHDVTSSLSLGDVSFVRVMLC